jgi:hypothetical protein
MEECMCVDEQTCLIDARHFLKQHMLNKFYEYGLHMNEIFNGGENEDGN